MTVLRSVFIIFLAVVLPAFPFAAAEEPALPEGLGGDDEEPSLPEGPGGDEPALPEGLGDGDDGGKKTGGEEREEFTFPFDVAGFAEIRLGTRTQNDPYQKDESLAEARFQVGIDKYWTGASFEFTADFIYDDIPENPDIYLEDGRGWIDLREMNAGFTPASFTDIKIGRQILTWGTGDLIFVADLFPKDWRSFFTGRDTEYLKAPSDALKAGFFNEAANLDIVYTPRFDSDRYIVGRRISYWNPLQGRRAGRDVPVAADKPEDILEDDEWAIRIYRNIKAYEVALYGYKGFWKSPGGIDPLTGGFLFPDLSVYAASVRGTVGKGIGNIEAGYYDSEDDPGGDDPFVDNSQFRFLAGYERELGRDFTAALQYYLERMINYGEYEKHLPPGAPEADENRHVVTLRLTKLLMNQDLTLSFFGYYSPSDEDGYLRPNIHYKLTDRWGAEIGGNLFFGNEDHTFFGQFEKNTNIYAGVRYSFVI